MTRWILLALALIGSTLTFVAKSPGVLALGLLLGGVGLFGFIFALAAERVAQSARPDAAMAAPEDLARLGRRAARHAPSQTPAPPAPRDNGPAHGE